MRARVKIIGLPPGSPMTEIRDKLSKVETGPSEESKRRTEKLTERIVSLETELGREVYQRTSRLGEIAAEISEKVNDLQSMIRSAESKMEVLKDRSDQVASTLRKEHTDGISEIKMVIPFLQTGPSAESDRRLSESGVEIENLKNRVDRLEVHWAIKFLNWLTRKGG